MSRELSLQQALALVPLPAQVSIRPWRLADVAAVRELSLGSGWTTLRDRPEDGLRAWQNSWPALVLTYQEEVIGFLRALTDEAVTLYIAEILVTPEWRKKGLGTRLLEVCHALYPTTRLDLISSGYASRFYQAQGFHPFQGFRKSFL